MAYEIQKNNGHIQGGMKGRNNKGHIELILGPMFSGKSTELMRRLKRYQVAQYKVMIVKYAKDVRYDEDGIATHCGMKIPATVSTTRLGEITSKISDEDYDVIGIDEGQFFPDVVQWSEKMANLGKFVVVAALDGTFQRKPFGDILSLVPLSETVTKLNSVCMNCFGDAAFSKRITAEDDEKVEVIGGADKYMAVCRACFHHDGVKVAVSPRLPSKTKSFSHSEEFVSPAKKMLFSDSATTASAL